MNASHWFTGLTGAVLTGLLSACLPAQQVRVLPPEPQPAAVQVSYEVATRGPLHEAFAQPYSSDLIPGVTVDVAPPEPIEEIPPDVAPEGENIVWVPGYWGWEPDEGTFIWISGIWRNVPPGQQWVPGYWTEVDAQHQWVSGFWTREDMEAIVYLPYPPESDEDGPVSASPEGDYFWVPGTWLWVGAEYQWQPGYWSRAYEEWVWSPSQYVWTPYGCIYTPGYWDFRPTHRGIVFAPVYIPPHVVRTRVVRYTPSVIVQVPRTLVHWFVSPTYHHYYFGNYYGRPYEQLNLVPWYAYHAQRGAYDPLLNYYRWYYARRNVDFVDRLERWYQFYAFYEDRRPPVTFAQQRALIGRVGGEDATAGRFRLAQSVDEVLAERDPERRFRRLQREQRQELVQASEALRQVQQLRNRVERMAAREPEERPGIERRDALRRLELPDRVTRRLWRDDVAGRADRPDRGRPDERRLTQDGRDRPAAPDRDRRPRERDEDGERIRTARPITPPEGDVEPRQQPRRAQEEPSLPRGRGPGDERTARPQPPPALPPREEGAPGRPGRVEGGQQPDAAATGEPRQGPPRRGRPRGFDGRSLPDRVPPALREGEAPDREGRRQGIPPFGARRLPDGERPDAARGPRRGLGPLDEQPPAIDRDDPRGRGSARLDRARGAARAAQPRPQPGRGPAADRPDREDDRRGPPQRAGRGRPERGDRDEEPRVEPPEEPEDDESDD